MFSRFKRWWFGMWHSTPKVQVVTQRTTQPASPPQPRKRSEPSSVAGQSSSSSCGDDGFAQSVALGCAFDNGVLGGVIGGNMIGGMIGGMIGDAMRSSDPETQSATSATSATSVPSVEATSYEPPSASSYESPISSANSGSSSSYDSGSSYDSSYDSGSSGSGSFE